MLCLVRCVFRYLGLRVAYSRVSCCVLCVVICRLKGRCVLCVVRCVLRVVRCVLCVVCIASCVLRAV